MIRFEVRVHSPKDSVRRRIRNIAEALLDRVLAKHKIFGYNIDWDPEEYAKEAPFARITGTIHTTEKLENEVTTTIDIIGGKAFVWLVPLE